jgi:protein-S-isoprenylcysteine O-methyltransferase
MSLDTPYILAAAWGISEMCLMATKRSGAGSTSSDRSSLQLIWVAAVGGIALGIFLAFRLRDWAFPWHTQVSIAGFCCFIAGVVLRWYSIIYLGRFFTVNVAIAADHKLIDSGPYRWLRHPSYTGALLTFIGLGLCAGNMVSFVVMVVPYCAAVLWRIHVEEAALLKAFGDQYRSYMQRTRRLIPLVY